MPGYGWSGPGDLRTLEDVSLPTVSSGLEDGAVPDEVEDYALFFLQNINIKQAWVYLDSYKWKIKFTKYK